MINKLTTTLWPGLCCVVHLANSCTLLRVLQFIGKGCQTCLRFSVLVVNIPLLDKHCLSRFFLPSLAAMFGYYILSLHLATKHLRTHI